VFFGTAVTLLPKKLSFTNSFKAAAAMASLYLAELEYIRLSFGAVLLLLSIKRPFCGFSKIDVTPHYVSASAVPGTKNHVLVAHGCGVCEDFLKVGFKHRMSLKAIVLAKYLRLCESRKPSTTKHMSGCSAAGLPLSKF
jgi:hypothetical protein